MLHLLVDNNRKKSLKWSKTSENLYYIFRETFHVDRKNENNEHVKWIEIQRTRCEASEYAEANETKEFPHIKEMNKKPKKDDVYSNKHV